MLAMATRKNATERTENTNDVAGLVKIQCKKTGYIHECTKEDAEILFKQGYEKYTPKKGD